MGRRGPSRPGPDPDGRAQFVRLAMRALLIAVRGAPAIGSIALPGLCTGVGRMPYQTAAAQMRAAYDSVIGETWRGVVHSSLAPFVTHPS